MVMGPKPLSYLRPLFQPLMCYSKLGPVLWSGAAMVIVYMVIVYVKQGSYGRILVPCCAAGQRCRGAFGSLILVTLFSVQYSD